MYGNMTGNQNFRVYEDGALLVFGNFASTGSNVDIQGTLVVAGDFLTSSSTTVDGEDGNLIVGGDFKASGGINTQSDNLYILDPNSDIDYPQNGNDYGGLVDLIKKEDDPLKDLIEEVIPGFVNYASINKWVGGEDSEWVNEKNWTGNSVPEPGASVWIKSSDNNPVIRDGNPVLLDNLTIDPSAKLTLSYGAQITVKGKLNINSVGGLILENKVGPDGLSSLITNGEVNGQVNVKMNIEGDRWYYLSSPVKTPTYSDFGVDENSPKDFRLDVYRRARWISIALEYAESRIRDLEGVAVKNYLGGTHSIDMVGELNSGEIVRAFAEGGWHIFGNPYPSAIQWSSPVGWDKENILPTIWFRTVVGSELTYVTYNAENDISSHTPEDASEYYTVGDDFSLIPPYQAVWIRTATDAPASITVDNQVRLHEKSTDEDVKAPQLKGGTLNKGEFSKIRIVAANEFSRDGSVIYFSDTNAEGFGTEDSEKYFNDSKNVPEVYTMLGNRSLAINGVPNVAESVKSFPISVRNRVEGNVSLRFDLREYNGEHDVYFEDKETGAFLNVERNSIYDYSVNRTGECHDRFVLHLYKVTTDIEEVRSDNDEVAAGEAISIKSVGGKVLVSASMDLVQQNPGNIGIYTIDGRKISEIPARSSRTLVLLPNERGVYIVRAQFGQLVKSQRVINAAQ